VFSVRYDLSCYIPEDGILYSHSRENLKSNIVLTNWAMQRRCSVFPVRDELSVYIPEDYIFHSHRSENLKYYRVLTALAL
jgi:hypothetical protein